METEKKLKPGKNWKLSKLIVETIEKQVATSTSRAISIYNMAEIRTSPNKLFNVMLPCLIFETVVEDKKGNVIINAFKEMAAKRFGQEYFTPFTRSECILLIHRLNVLLAELKHSDGAYLFKQTLNTLMELGEEEETEGEYLNLSESCKHSYQLFEIASKYYQIQTKMNVESQKITITFYN